MPLSLLLLAYENDGIVVRLQRVQHASFASRLPVHSSDAERFIFDEAAEIRILQQSVIQFKSARFFGEPGHTLLSKAFGSANALPQIS